MAVHQDKGALYAADVTTIAAGATYTTDSADLNIIHRRYLTIQGYATGANASSAGDVTFTIVAKVNGKWSTSAYATHVVTVSGTSAKVAAPEVIEVFGVDAVRVDQIVNGDATYAVGTLNINYSLTD